MSDEIRITISGHASIPDRQVVIPKWAVVRVTWWVMEAALEAMNEAIKDLIRD